MEIGEKEKRLDAGLLCDVIITMDGSDDESVEHLRIEGTNSAKFLCEKYGNFGVIELMKKYGPTWDDKAGKNAVSREEWLFFLW